MCIRDRDGSRPLDENDREIIELIRGRKAIVLLNKTDLQMAVDEEQLRETVGQPVIPVSAKEQKGIDALEEQIKEMFLSGDIDFNEDVYKRQM